MKIITFPILAIVLCLLAYNFPSFFTPRAEYINDIFKYMLIIIMLSMGLNLNISDFKQIVKTKKSALTLGLILQFSIMPFAAYIISIVLNLDKELTIGMILVGSTAGGTASNVITYLSRGDLGLSISMTLLSTMLSVILTPILSLIYLGENIEVPALKMLSSLIQITLIPIIVGTLINTFANKAIQKIKKLLPIISMIGILSLICIIIAINSNKIAQSAYIAIIAVVAHNLTGMCLGYFIARIFKFNNTIARTIAIEVGMQNSGLAIALAKSHFIFAPLATIPGAIFSIWHNISGTIFATIFTLKDNKIQK